MENFALGTPALVCRWRLYNRKLPLENRHLRALGRRRINEATTPAALVAWAKQHLEWTLDDGARDDPNGVLMLAVDTRGRAAMAVGSYQPLERATANDLLQRALGGRREAERTGVSPEDLWLVRGDTLAWGTSSEFAPSGTSSLIFDLACTLGMPVVRDEDLLGEVQVRGFAADEVFLVSDEHGVVPARDRTGRRAQKFADSYHKLLGELAPKGGRAL